MKKIVSYILLSALMITFLPYSALAETTDVGVKVTGSASIEVVTTISADITVDLTTGKTTPTYMEIQNNSLVPVNAKITNISTTSEGAPTSFVKALEKDWNHLSKEDTKKYVNFNILGEGQDVKAQDILPNTEIDLGKIGAASLALGSNCVGWYICEYESSLFDIGGNSYYANYNVYEINTNLGKNWDEGDKSFTYQIETVYSKADSEATDNISIATMDSIGNLYLNFEHPENVISSRVDQDTSFANKFGLTDSTKQYFSLYFGTNDVDEFYNQLISNKINIIISDSVTNEIYEAGRIAITKDDLQYLFAGAETGDGGGGAYYTILFSMPKLESSSEGTIHYLRTNITISKDTTSTTFTFIKKIVIYSE